jgi:uracil-DNA glycosylase
MGDLRTLPGQVHPAWQPFLDAARHRQLQQVEARIGTDYRPEPGRVLRFLQVDLGAVRVVILGQDPYLQPGAATGRAFEVGSLRSWQEPFTNRSLQNLIRLLYKTAHGLEEYASIPPFSQIRQEIAHGRFPILPPDRLFAAWEAQGVLLLNTALTVDVRAGAGSHRQIWAEFAADLIGFISGQRPDLHWFLWGKSAQSFLPQIAAGNVHMSRHPMLCSPKYADDFLRADCFQQTWGLIDWLGTEGA